ncbi:hypothetical protein PYK79_56400 [Streptomyces sp. ID05-04B]|uniref:hypothetical protein n=1 Tax=unclassified Streptomyces TaxID=2593676 RepID=UPI000D1A3B30|nr:MULTISPECIES: hypothetical protein [unclassified Streptomyces]AVV46444.1 hypothetical protein C6376_38905 [Streptomyces sp. P3]AVV46503.1 hypothetical protein C6376_39205 [Streptomyces sp. P3]MDX5570813.1 hypothetical protein [Streptomyces sp. ID05-04B]
MTDAIWIRSTVHPETRKAACLLTWGSAGTALLTPEAALATARDLTAAAAAAEADVALIRSLREDVHADDAVVRGLLEAVRARRPVPTAARPALRIHAVAGAKTGKPLVHIGRGSLKAELDPDEARQMAGHWTEAAVAAQIDARLRYVLGEHPSLTAGDVNAIFEQLQGVQR